MVIAGAGGHASEIYDVLNKNGNREAVYFFDDINDISVFQSKPVLNNEEQLKEVFTDNPSFVLGIGNPASRKFLSEKFLQLGGQLTSIISDRCTISDFNVALKTGLNVMDQVTISNNVSIDIGTLVNTASSIHHGATIGAYCEICPGARILGDVQVGDHCFVGTNAVILPGISIAKDVAIGAGTIVTKDVAANSVVVGVPGRSKY